MGAVLVTGGAGYIGSHAVRVLRAAGYEVIVLDSLVAGHRKAVQGALFVEADVADQILVRETLRKHSVSAVMHFAAFVSVGQSIQKPSEYYANNLSGTLALLDAMVAESVHQFVFSSTAAVYGEPRECPVSEDHPTVPINPYGETKLAIERALPYYERAYGLRSVRLRYFNAAGADPEGDIGEHHEPEEHLIPKALAAAGSGLALDVYGDDYDTPDGTCVRDYVHVSDLASAHLLALGALKREGYSAVYNLGSGRGYSVREVVAAVEFVTGVRMPCTVVPRRAGDPAVLVASNDRARVELGWKPEHETLEAIVESACAWHQSHPHGYAS